MSAPAASAVPNPDVALLGARADAAALALRGLRADLERMLDGPEATALGPVVLHAIGRAVLVAGVAALFVALL